jgi:hypothetical protein
MRALLLVVLTLGCSSTSDKLRARFAKEKGCTADETMVTEEGGTSYRASGCGKTAEYVCPSFGSMGDAARACEERGLSKKPGADPKPLPGAYPMSPPEPPGHKAN